MADDETSPKEPNEDFVDGEVQRLLRRLVRQVVRRASVPPGELSVVLELEVDGLRCVTLVESAASSYGALSPREQEIARMVGAGYPNKTIAARLGISSWTVSTHLRRMFAKVGVNSRAALVARVLEQELVFDERRVLPR
jgi:DNA-binding CsgD family transcriptional regulator